VDEYEEINVKAQTFIMTDTIKRKTFWSESVFFFIQTFSSRWMDS
jgi:hypothetical protein